MAEQDDLKRAGGATLPDPLGSGAFLHFTGAGAGARHVFALGDLGAGVRRWTACHRYEPFWMTAWAGADAGSLPGETQSLLGERDDGSCLLLVPLIDGPFRCALQGDGAGGLELVAETGDPDVTGDAVTGLYIAAGPDPYALVEAGARSVAAHLQSGRLRRDKPLPDWADKFGWCTWDAFYQEVSHEKVKGGLESFRAGGVTPRLLILDDGWQSVEATESGQRRLAAFAANAKFPGDLGPTVAMAKGEFGIEEFLVWHAMNGYWGGVDGDRLPGYGVRDQARAHSPAILQHEPAMDGYAEGRVGTVAPDEVYRFFQDYHRHLRRQGVDGVKVDSQATLESVAAGLGGRVGLMRHYREALEGSAQTHFRGNLINCMSCANEMLYGTLASTLTRTSTDFWPDRPASHGAHLYVNAQVGVWFGEFVHPDWDMFQSGHALGAYHAAGRAVAGCPVYVSDRPGAHDFALLRKMVLPDGAVLRADAPGRPTRDCLFHDPTREDVLLKIYNHSGGAGLLGVFHARYGEGEADAPPIAGSIGPRDVEGLGGERFAVYAHTSGALRLMGPDERWGLALPPLGYEVFVVAPVRDGLAPLGLADMFNSAGAVTSHGFGPDGVYRVALRAGGRFLAWSESAPASVHSGGRPLDFAYDPATHRLEFTAPGDGPCVLELEVVRPWAALTPPAVSGAS